MRVSIQGRYDILKMGRYGGNGREILLIPTTEAVGRTKMGGIKNIK
jgi:hypothetical protein